MIRLATLSAAAFFLALASPALADPCGGKLSSTKAGTTFSGPIEYVGDGDSACVRTREGLIEVRIADFNAPELSEPDGPAAKRALSRIAMNRRVDCEVVRGRSGKTTSYDRVIAVCTLGGRSMADWLSEAGVKQGGR